MRLFRVPIIFSIFSIKSRSSFTILLMDAEKYIFLKIVTGTVFVIITVIIFVDIISQWLIAYVPNIKCFKVFSICALIAIF